MDFAFILRRILDAGVRPKTETRQDVRENGVNPLLPRNCERPR